MIHQQTSFHLGNIRNWTNAGSSVRDRVRTQTSGDIPPNGTFLIGTSVGTARVYMGDIFVEHQSQLWSRPLNEVSQLIDKFGAEAALPIASIGPGKDVQFGTKSKAGKGKRCGGEREIGFQPSVGKPSSIECLHTTELSVDGSYQ